MFYINVKLLSEMNFYENVHYNNKHVFKKVIVKKILLLSFNIVYVVIYIKHSLDKQRKHRVFIFSKCVFVSIDNVV